MKGKYLITTDNWFIAPDGKSYRAVWGEAQTMTAVEALGVEPNRNSANWMVKVGTEEHHIILAGCQIHYAVSCPNRPNLDRTLQKWENEVTESYKDNVIYIPEDSAEKALENPPGKMEDYFWETCKTKLISIVSEMPNYYFTGHILDKSATLRRISGKGFKKFRFIRLPYKKQKTLQIFWDDENLQEFKDPRK